MERTFEPFISVSKYYLLAKRFDGCIYYSQNVLKTFNLNGDAFGTLLTFTPSAVSKPSLACASKFFYNTYINVEFKKYL
jgi:hypothetical protein